MIGLSLGDRGGAVEGDRLAGRGGHRVAGHRHRRGAHVHRHGDAGAAADLVAAAEHLELGLVAARLGEGMGDDRRIALAAVAEAPAIGERAVAGRGRGVEGDRGAVRQRPRRGDRLGARRSAGAGRGGISSATGAPSASNRPRVTSFGVSEPPRRVIAAGPPGASNGATRHSSWPEAGSRRSSKVETSAISPSAPSKLCRRSAAPAGASKRTSVGSLPSRQRTVGW